MSKEDAHSNDLDYHCVTCGMVYLHDSNTVIEIGLFHDLFGDSRKVSSGYVCSEMCSRVWLLDRMESMGREKEHGAEEKYNLQVEDYAHRLADGGKR